MCPSINIHIMDGHFFNDLRPITPFLKHREQIPRPVNKEAHHDGIKNC